MKIKYALNALCCVLVFISVSPAFGNSLMNLTDVPGETEILPQPSGSASYPTPASDAGPAVSDTNRDDRGAVAGCSMFPSDNIWNVPVDTLPLDVNSSSYINT
ncbi:MAG: hypothetical protein HQK57_13315, partial [Deltaproteobacteria bacterium]|nr:hypothetical protein [Deltaproteobacteria bacterium]